jgi:coenzyme F420-reducing hydrogenase beta subunit
MMLARGRIPDAQWTGCVTGIAVSMLEAGKVDAVVCIACREDGNDPWSEPEPILARSVKEVMRGRGVKPVLAPSLRILDELRESPDVKKLLFCGVGCAVQAFRAIQHELLLEEVYVLGTNCADNSPTPEDAREFLRRSVPEIAGSKQVLGYEFMQDFRVHVKYDDGSGSSAPSYERKPYFCKLSC